MATRWKQLVYVSSEQLPDHGFMIEHDSVQCSFVHEPHHNPVLHPSHENPSDTKADGEIVCMDPEQPPVLTSI